MHVVHCRLSSVYIRASLGLGLQADYSAEGDHVAVDVTVTALNDLPVITSTPVTIPPASSAITSATIPAAVASMTGNRTPTAIRTMIAVRFRLRFNRFMRGP